MGVGRILLLVLLTHLRLMAADVVIVPTFAAKNWIAGLNIPLRVTGISLPASVNVLAELESGSIDAKDCRVMRDPFIPENFLLRCLKDGTVSLKLSINPPTIDNPYAETTVLKYGPITIQKLEGLKLPDNNDSGPNPDLIAGQQLFSAYCLRCHTKNEKPGRSGDAIWNSIRNVESMKITTLLGLTRSEVDQISVYLKAP